MKKIFILFLIISITSCDNSSTLQSVLDSNDVDKIKLKRKEIAESQQEFFNKLLVIDNKLDELNTNQIGRASCRERV